MPIYNQSRVDIKNDITKWKTINDDACRLINRYLFKTYPSKYSNLDYEDRYVLLSTPGLHSLLTFNPKDPSIVQTPFMLPEGTNVQRLGIELPITYSDKRIELLEYLKASVVEPNFLGLYEETDSDDSFQIPIAHFAGFNILANFTESYKVQIERLKSLDTTGTKTNEKGTGFNNVEENIEWITKKNEMHKAKDPNEILKKLMSKNK
jgi:hypothetical protein